MLQLSSSHPTHKTRKRVKSNYQVSKFILVYPENGSKTKNEAKHKKLPRKRKKLENKSKAKLQVGPERAEGEGGSVRDVTCSGVLRTKPKKPQPFAVDFQGKNDLWRKCIGTQCKVEGAAGHSTHTHSTHTHTHTAAAPPGESGGRRTRISFSTFSLHNNNFYAAGVCFFLSLSSIPFFIAFCFYYLLAVCVCCVKMIG